MSSASLEASTLADTPTNVTDATKAAQKSVDGHLTLAPVYNDDHMKQVITRYLQAASRGTGISLVLDPDVRRR